MAFEEPEVLIHPPATSYLTELMDEASLRGQVIVSTHSPDFIARFPPESLRVFEMVDGATQISPLRADQMQSIKEHLFDAGELLQIEGLKRG
jgi:type I restriction enzyme M protein